MALRECENGHIYDDVLNSSCPYCNGGIYRVDFGAGSDDVGRTVLLDEDPREGAASGAGEIGKTVRLDETAAAAQAPLAQQVPQTSQAPQGHPAAGQTDISISGWIVCTSGADKGKDITVRSGETFELNGGTYVFVPFKER